MSSLHHPFPPPSLPPPSYSSSTRPALGTRVARLPPEVRLLVFSYVIGSYVDSHPQTASPVSKQEYHPKFCQVGPYPAGYSFAVPDPPPARCKYLRVRPSQSQATREDLMREPLLSYDVHNCRDPAPGIRDGLRAVLFLLDAYPKETVQLVRDDPGLRSAELDVYYLEGVGMWTRWTRLPPVAMRHLDTLRVRVRASTGRLRVQEDAARLKHQDLMDHEARFSMLPLLLGSVWRLGLLSAWGGKVIDRDQYPGRNPGLRPSGSFRRVVVDVVPVRPDEIRDVPTRLCSRCGAMLDFVDPPNCEAEDQQSTDNEDDDDGAEGSEGSQGSEDSGDDADSEPEIADPSQIARGFWIGLMRFVRDKERSASLRQTIAQVEIQSEGSLLGRGVIRLSNPLDFHHAERAVTENAVRYLHESLEEYLGRLAITTNETRERATGNDREYHVCCELS